MEVVPLPETTARSEALLAAVALPAVEQPPRSVSREQENVPFVGRETERAALNPERSRVMGGPARVVLLTGDLGMGKSRLWQTWGALHRTDMLVLTTHALETTAAVPFGPILNLFRQPGPAHASVHPPSPLVTLWLTELTRLLPELALVWPTLPPPLALAPAEERGRLLQALDDALCQDFRAGDGPARGRLEPAAGFAVGFDGDLRACLHPRRTPDRQFSSGFDVVVVAIVHAAALVVE